MAGWIGVDFDGTLAEYNGWQGPTNLGKPVPAMVERVLCWLDGGADVRIVTARAYAPADDPVRQADTAKAVLAIQDWCIEHLGCVLPVTCTKDFSMIELWDDRAVQVIPNTGLRADGDNNAQS